MQRFLDRNGNPIHIGDLVNLPCLVRVRFRSAPVGLSIATLYPFPGQRKGMTIGVAGDQVEGQPGVLALCRRALAALEEAGLVPLLREELRETLAAVEAARRSA